MEDHGGIVSLIDTAKQKEPGGTQSIYVTDSLALTVRHYRSNGD